MPNSWPRRLLVKERTGAKVGRPVQKVCGMIERNTLRACGLAGAMVLFVAAFTLASGFEVDLASAETLKNPIAVFAALDKVTGRISHLEIPMNKTVAFGALKVTPRVCDTRPPTEAPEYRLLRRGRRGQAHGRGAAHLYRLDVRRKPRPSRRRAPGVRRLAHELQDAGRRDALGQQREGPARGRRAGSGSRTCAAASAPCAGRGGRAAGAVALGQAAA